MCAPSSPYDSADEPSARLWRERCFRVDKRTHSACRYAHSLGVHRTRKHFFRPHQRLRQKRGSESIGRTYRSTPKNVQTSSHHRFGSQRSRFQPPEGSRRVPVAKDRVRCNSGDWASLCRARARPSSHAPARSVDAKVLIDTFVQYIKPSGLCLN